MKALKDHASAISVDSARQRSYLLSMLPPLEKPQQLACLKALLGDCHAPLQGEEYADNAKLLKDLLGCRIGEEGHGVGKDRRLDDDEGFFLRFIFPA